jgi:hypothetical protein
MFIPQTTYEHEESWWNDTDRRTQRKICLRDTPSITNPTLSDPGAKPGLWTATNRMIRFYVSLL